MNPDDQHVATPDLEKRQIVVAEIWGEFRAVHGLRHIRDGGTPAIGFLLGYSMAGAEVGICRRIRLEPADPAVRLRLRITLAWFVFWAVHGAVMVPLYLANKVVTLCAVASILGKRALVAVVAVTWLWGRARAPRPFETSGPILENEAT